MLATVIQKISSFAYRHPYIEQNKQGAGPFGKLKIAVLADYFTSVCLAAECSVRILTPKNYTEVIKYWRPDLVFVESAFHGVGDEWRYKLMKQPKYIRFLPSNEVRNISTLARDRNIPAIFWNKDDSAFFNAFIDVAKNFQYVFTTDSSCLQKYRRRLPPDSESYLLSMAYQPAFHNFNGFSFKVKGACFVGSYYRKFFGARRRFLDMIFDACDKTFLPLHIYDRNSRRFSHFFEFRFPQRKNLSIHPGVDYPQTAEIYKSHIISVNVNSIVSSATMYSRRLLEILACGGICITNRNLCIEKEFNEFCHIVSSPEQACETIARLAFGPSQSDLDMAAAGAAHVASRHTWTHRLQQLEDTVKF